MSWVEVGALLGISKQAAQQRFGGVHDVEVPPADAIVVKLGATPLSETRILDMHGAAGRELIEVGTFRLVFRQTEERWEHRRSVGPIATDRVSAEGWEPVGRWFVFHYYKRPVAPA